MTFTSTTYYDLRPNFLFSASFSIVLNARANPILRFDRATLDATGGEAEWLQQARALVADLYEHSPAVYWTDFLLSVAGASVHAVIYFLAPPWSAVQVIAFVLSAVLFLRAGTFMPELVHLRRGQMPWIMYRNHADHHSTRPFGTPADAEYLPLAASPARESVKYLVQIPLMPLFMVVRFGIRAGADRFAYLCMIAALVVAGVITGMHLLKACLLLAFALALNWVRTLAVHGFGNRGDRMTYVEQMSDSINITGQTWLTIFLFPALPYHNLGRAARRSAREDSAMPRWHSEPRRT